DARASAPHAGRLDREPLRPPREIELELRELGRALGRHRRTDAEEARAKPPLERSERLPFEPVRRPRVAVSLADRLGEQTPAGVLLVTARARQVHLAATRVIEVAGARPRGVRGTVDRYVERQAARRVRDRARQREQVLGFARERGRAHLPRAATVDPVLEIDDAAL